MKWSDLSIKDYNRIQELLSDIPDEVTMSERQEQILIEIGGYTKDELLQMPVLEFVHLFDKEFGFLSNEIPKRKPVKLFRAGWGIYKINYDITSLTKGQYDEVVQFSSVSGMKNMHLYLASVSKPVWWWPFGKKDHAAKAKAIEGSKFLVGYYISVFFYLLYRDLLTDILTSLEGETVTRERREMLMSLLPTLDSFSTTS
jgi:hypothetical protein